MKRIERLRQVVSGPLESTDLQKRTDEGWRLVAVEWERVSKPPTIGCWLRCRLRIAPDAQRLEENPAERERLLHLMKLIVQEGSYAHIAHKINRIGGFRTRQGAWTPISVFEMLPRLIEVSPQLFQAEWQKRRQPIPKEH